MAFTGLELVSLHLNQNLLDYFQIKNYILFPNMRNDGEKKA